MIEVKEGGIWRPVTGAPARIRETDTVSLRGIGVGTRVRLGPVELTSNAAGAVDLRLAQYEELDCHVGMLAIDAPVWRGEVEILPGKISQDAFEVLRSDLETTWTGLVFDDGAPTSLRARGPDARALWRLMGPAVDEIRREPVRKLGAVTAYLRLERVRRAGELTPAVLIAGQRGLPARAQVLGSALAAPEHAFVADTLRRLAALARRQLYAETVASDVTRWLRESPFDDHREIRVAGALHSIRHDKRFRVVQRVRRELEHPAAVVTEGPGELRLGVRGLNRLYEYWVFLQILKTAARELGPPEKPGFEVLARRLVGGRLRLELAAGTTVCFPGGWHVSFEPRISPNPAASWEGLEYVPHPDPRYQKSFITPDVCVFCRDESPRLYVIDAKYRGRYQIDPALAETHASYGRIRFRGQGIVEEVIVAHPHRSLALRWAGQSAQAYCPGYEAPGFPPFLRERAREIKLVVSSDMASVAPSGTEGSPTRSTSGPKAEGIPPVAASRPTTRRVMIIVDQTWMREHVGLRRVDLRSFAREIAGDRSFDVRLVAPDLPGLEGFFTAITRLGFTVERTGLPRKEQLKCLEEICAGAGDVDTYVVSGRSDFIRTAQGMQDVIVIQSI